MNSFISSSSSSSTSCNTCSTTLSSVACCISGLINFRCNIVYLFVKVFSKVFTLGSCFLSLPYSLAIEYSVCSPPTTTSISYYRFSKRKFAFFRLVVCLYVNFIINVFKTVASFLVTICLPNSSTSTSSPAYICFCFICWRLLLNINWVAVTFFFRK